jgi:hypothetical protein
MDAGSRSIEVIAPPEPVPWMRASLVWMLMMLVETGHGMVREVFIAPVLGALRARQLGVLVGSVLVLLIAWACARGLRATTRRQQLIVGAYWVGLTLIFELAVGRATGASWDRLLSDYHPLRGGFMLLGLAVIFIAPRLTGRRHS